MKRNHQTTTAPQEPLFLHDSSVAIAPSSSPFGLGAYNRAYLALLRFAQIPLRRTSDPIGTLYEIDRNIEEVKNGRRRIQRY